MFDKIYQNIRNTKQINNDKYPKFYLLSFNIEVDVKVLPLGWNTQKKLLIISFVMQIIA